MSEAKHTPGPWMIAGGLSIKAPGRHIAKVGAPHLDSATDHANAALIARAPEMSDELARLRAENERLREALEQFAEADLNDSNCASFEVANRRIRRVARAALSKANGEVSE